MSKLSLKSARTSRSSSERNKDDYDVTTSNGVTVGRIFKSVHAPKDVPWSWTIQFNRRRPGPLPPQGYAADRDKALEALTASWLAMEKQANDPRN
jgi:hypothetical protein